MSDVIIPPHSRRELVYHLGIVLLLGIAAITGVANLLHSTLTEPAPAVWVPAGECFTLDVEPGVLLCPAAPVE